MQRLSLMPPLGAFARESGKSTAQDEESSQAKIVIKYSSEDLLDTM
jgi:hypothetical protein